MFYLNIQFFQRKAILISNIDKKLIDYFLQINKSLFVKASKNKITVKQDSMIERY